MLYEEELLQSAQLLPRWHQGNVSWVTAREAIRHVYNLTSGATPAADLDFPTFSGCMPCIAPTSALSAPMGPAVTTDASASRRASLPAASLRSHAKEPTAKRVRVAAATSSAGGGRQKVARGTHSERLPQPSNFQGVLQSPEALECMGFSDALHNSMGSSSGIDVCDDADANSLFGEFRQLFAENAQTTFEGSTEPPVPLIGSSGKGSESLSFGDGNALRGNISLTEINSASLNEILGSRSFTDLGSALSFSHSRQHLKDANASDVSISSYLDRASSAFVHNEGLREIMYEFGANV